RAEVGAAALTRSRIGVSLSPHGKAPCNGGCCESNNSIHSFPVRSALGPQGRFQRAQRMRRDIEVAPEQVDLFYVTPDGELEYPSGAISREGSTYALNAAFDNVPTDAELLAAVEAERVKQAAENAARERSHREHQERQRAAETERAVKAVEGYRAWMALPESERVYWDAYPRVRGDCDFDS